MDSSADIPTGQPSQLAEPHNIPDNLGIIVRQDLVVFPLMITQLQIDDEQSRSLIDDALSHDRIIGLVGLPTTGDPSADDIEFPRIATAGVIHKMLKLPDGTVNMLVQGLSRITLTELTQQKPYPVAQVELLESESDSGDLETQALARNVAGEFQRLISAVPHFPDDWRAVVQTMNPRPDHLSDFVASNLSIDVSEKQTLLETVSVVDRLKSLTRHLNNELQVVELSAKIQTQVQSEMNQNQREFYLRKQLETIRQELGEEDEHTVEIRELRERLDTANLPQHALEAANRELDRLSKMPPAAAEYTVARSYLDWLVELPWNMRTEDNLDIQRAREVLDADHYGLEKIKDRILEYLSVRKLKDDMKGPILCFSGPPGVGKTSLGQSIARALGRKFIRLSLGGVRDEAEIRGHRRTYVGALPGRIIQGLRRAGTCNPLFMLDEVDKLGQDFRGDPTSALLEVLDPEQNSAFSDHYVEVDFDLSNVMFITTANQLGPIPPPLRDRMEILDLAGYTDTEKLQIAKRHLIPRQRDAHGLNADLLQITHGATRRVVESYTKEAGVRSLERQIGTLCRKVARKYAEGDSGPFKVSVGDVREHLGLEMFQSEVAEQVLDPGVVTGMAATTVGGEIIFIEAARMPGKGGLQLTGQLGEVMKESAQTALSFVRSQGERLGIDDEVFRTSDIHIHVPAGATPKEGPSAGITLTTALVSLLTGRRARSDVSMTGEITLRGRVMPIGGVKEKSLAAHRAGIKTIVLPSRNRRDLDDIPEQVQQKVEIVFVEHVDEVLDLVLEKRTEPVE
jgi:ATP-dependent Lon protease